MSRYFRTCGLPAWDWSLFQAIGRGRGCNLEIDVSRLIPSWNELFDAVAGGEVDGFTVTPVLKYLNNFLHGPGRNNRIREECGSAGDLLSMSSDGAMEACDCIDPQGPLSNLGHIGSTRLEEARDSAKASAIRSRDVRGGKCGECIWLAVCGGTCLARSPGL